MIKLINTRLLFLILTLFALTSSCEDKKHHKFGSVALSFDYIKEVQLSGEDNQENNSRNSNDEDSDIPIKPSFIKKENGILDIPIKINNTNTLSLDSENKESEVIVSDVNAASIAINGGIPTLIDLNTQTTYQKTNLPVGSITVTVELLDNLLNNLALYRQAKTVNIIENQIVNVTFDTWFVMNQTIEVNNIPKSQYTAGEPVVFTWTNTHSEQKVRIKVFKNDEGNIIKNLDNSFIGGASANNIYNWTTTESDVGNTLGIKIESDVTLMDGSRASSTVCCFDIVSGNSAPVSANEGITTDEDTPVRTGFSSSDAEGDALTYIVVTQPSNGTVTIDNSEEEPGLYTPNADWNGTDTFTYKANDGFLDSNVATATVTVVPVNDAPTTIDVSAQTDENLSVAKNIIVGITLEGNDVDGDNLTYSIVTQPSNGSLSGISGNTVTYSAGQDWNGTDTFTYKVNDGTEDSNISTVTITVNAVNDAPTTNDITTSTDEDVAKDITLDGSDVDTGDTLSYGIVSDVSNGSTNVSGATVTYTPTADWNGTDTFTYKVNDGTEDSNISTVTITVNAVNDAPTTDGGKTYSTPKNTALDIILDGNDADGDALTYSITEDNNGGNASLSLSGNVVTVTPTSDPSVNISFNFKYKVSDGDADSEESMVIVWLIANEFTNPISTSQWSTGTTETIAWTELFGVGVGLYLVKGNDFDGGLTTIVNPIPTEGSNIVRNYNYTPPHTLNDGDDYQVFIGQVTNGAPDGEYHFSQTFSIDQSDITETKTYQLISNGSMGGNQYDYTDFEITDVGAVADINIHLALNHNGGDDSLHFMELYLMSPKKTIVKFLDFNNGQSGKQLLNTVLDDEASATLDSASEPYIGTFKPLGGLLSTFDGEDINGTWTLIQDNHNGNGVTYTDFKLEIERSTLNTGTTYTETHDYIEDFDGSNSFSFGGNTTSTFDFPLNLPTGKVIKDIEFEFSLNHNGGTESLQFIDIKMDNGDTSTLTELFAIDNGELEQLHQRDEFKQIRFTMDNTYTHFTSEDPPLFRKKLYTDKDWSVFNETRPEKLRFYFINDNGNGGTIFNVKFFIKTQDEGNVAPVANNVSATTIKNTSVDITLNATDGNVNDNLTYSIVSSPSNGSLGSISDNSVTYTPNSSWSGTDTFTYKANDGTIDSNVATATITVNDNEVKEYELDSNETVTANNVKAYTISVGDNGELVDVNLQLSVQGNSSSHIRYLNGILVSPNRSRVHLFGGDQLNNECSQNGGCLDADAGSFTSTVFDDEASTKIYNGTAPFIGTFQPNENLSEFDGEEINGDWTLYILNATNNIVNAPNIKLTLTYDPSSSGTTYTETNNNIFSPDDTSDMTITANATGIITIPVSNMTIADLDFELSLKGNSSSHLRYMSVTVDIGDVADAELIYRGDQISGNGNPPYNKDSAVMYKARFDGEVGCCQNEKLMIDQRVGPIIGHPSGLDAFDGESLTQFRIYVFNGSNNTITVDRSNTKVYIKAANTNNAPTASNVTAKGYVEDGALNVGFVASDADGDNLTYSIVSNPSNGTVSITGNTATYTPVNFSGSDSFTYKANDGTEDSNVATATVGIYDIGKTSLYFNRDLSAGLEKSYLELPQNAGYLNSNDSCKDFGFTISMWLKPEAQLYDSGYLYSLYQDANNYWGLKLNNGGDGNGNISFEVLRNGSPVGNENFDGNLTVPLDGNTWTHVLVHLYKTCNNLINIEGFKNGQYVGGQQWAYANIQDLLFSLRNWDPIVGTQRKNVTNDTQYKGYIDEVLILRGSSSNGKMTSGHIAELYNNGYNLITPRTYFGTAYSFLDDYNFNQGSGLPTSEINGDNVNEMVGATWVTE